MESAYRLEPALSRRRDRHTKRPTALPIPKISDWGSRQTWGDSRPPNLMGPANHTPSSIITGLIKNEANSPPKINVATCQLWSSHRHQLVGGGSIIVPVLLPMGPANNKKSTPPAPAYPPGKINPAPQAMEPENR